MPIEIKPGPELDAAVAKACGIEGCVESLQCEATGYESTPRFVISDGVNLASDEYWSPSTGLNAAFEAAEKCGLFTPKNDTTSILVQSGDRWLINSQMRFQWGGMASPYETSSKTIGEGLTPALAICAAILKLKG